MPSTTSQQPARRRRRFFMPSQIAILLSLSFILLFVLAVVFARNTWLEYEASTQDWATTTCKLPEEEVTSVSQCPRSTRYEAKVFIQSIKQVETIHDFDIVEDADSRNFAHETSDRCSHENKSDAEAFAVSFESQAGRDVDCYTNGRRIRLTPGGLDSSERFNRRLHAVFAIIAAILAGAAVLYVIYHFRVTSSFFRRNSPQAPNTSRVRTASAPNYRRPLSVADTSMLVSSLPEGHDGGTCAICLEDFSDDERKARTLPCGHAYHEECALQWFRKGHASCPYCNHDLGDEIQRLREEQDQQTRGSPLGDSSGSSGTIDRTYWPSQWNRRARSSHVDNAS